MSSLYNVDARPALMNGIQGLIVNPPSIGGNSNLNSGRRDDNLIPNQNNNNNPGGLSEMQERRL